MLLPRKWVLSLGLLATAPGIALAGPFDGKSKSNARPAATRPTAPPADRPAASASGERSNNEIAQEIAQGMKAAGLKGKGIQIEVVDGKASLTGQILSAAQLAKATQVASRVPGIDSVDNQLTAIESASTAKSGSRQSIQQVQFEDQTPAAPGELGSTPAEPAGPSNQQVAQGIADKLAEAGLNGYDIEIRFKNGACSLIGDVSNPGEAQAAQQAAQSVPGVQRVLNRLSVAGRPAAPMAAPQQMGGRPQYPQGLAVGEGQLPPGIPPQAMGGNPQQIQQMQMQMQQARMMQMQQAQMQQAQMQQGGMGGPGMDGSAMGAPGMGGYPQGGVSPAGGHMMYNQPDVPEYAWPTYAQNDNYAAVTYPSQYDASAFPYIGPFYPYPQVPLNWRQSTLEWKDGTWNLRFSTKTDKWWWFMQPKNWD